MCGCFVFVGGMLKRSRMRCRYRQPNVCSRLVSRLDFEAVTLVKAINQG